MASNPTYIKQMINYIIISPDENEKNQKLSFKFKKNILKITNKLF